MSGVTLAEGVAVAECAVGLAEAAVVLLAVALGVAVAEVTFAAGVEPVPVVAVPHAARVHAIAALRTAAAMPFGELTRRG